MKIHHIGKVVKNIKKELEVYKKLGFKTEKEILIDKEQGMMVGVVYCNNLIIELLTPIKKNSSLWKFYKQGYFYHMCIEVESIDKYLEYIKENNLGFPLTKKTTSVFNKRKVQFIATLDRKIIELIQKNG